MNKTCLSCVATVCITAFLMAPSASPEDLPALTVRGKNIVDAHGTVVSMRGINFGGWLMMETWIPSIEMEWHDRLPKMAEEAGILEELEESLEAVGEFNDDEQSVHDYIKNLHTDLRDRVSGDQYAKYIALFEEEPPVYAANEMDAILRERFGDFGAARFWNAYHDTWITEADFQIAKAVGFNFVRIPFWYRWFESDDNPYVYNEYGFHYLDNAIAWAKDHGLYVMLDFHGAVGGQSPWDHTGELSRAEFFKNSEFQKRTAALWKAIAARYAHESTVWAYDALNEPFSAKGLKDWSEAHDRIYDAIREVDSDTIIVMEDGYKLEFEAWMHTGFFPKPEDMGWKNVVYSFHFYSGADPLFADEEGLADHAKRAEEVKRVGTMEQERCGVPIYIGEFSTMGDTPNDIEGMQLFLTMFNKLGWHWSPWTWKYVDDDNEGTIWGLYQYAHPWPRTPNIHRDSLESLLEVVDRYKLEDFKIMEPYGVVLRECLNQPVADAGN